MPTVLEAESTLTDRYQTTVPETVRRALKLGKRDKIIYKIRPPERLQVMDAAFIQRLQSLSGGIEVNLDAPWSADDE